MCVFKKRLVLEVRAAGIRQSVHVVWWRRSGCLLTDLSKPPWWGAAVSTEGVPFGKRLGIEMAKWLCTPPGGRKIDLKCNY